MVRVKICGITNLQDALAAAEGGADAVGFVFYPQSPRCVKPDQARSIIEQLPPYVSAVGVFADQPLEEVTSLMQGCRLDLVQLQGNESPEFCRAFGSRAVKAIRVRDRKSLEPMSRYRVRGFVLDAYVPDQFGGTGHRFDWELALLAKPYGRIILAGGLTPENVAEAIQKVRPFGVDVSSGVEERMGKKSPEKLERFIRQVREAG